MVVLRRELARQRLVGTAFRIFLFKNGTCWRLYRGRGAQRKQISQMQSQQHVKPAWTVTIKPSPE
jgi:hypothetical protein